VKNPLRRRTKGLCAWPAALLGAMSAGAAAAGPPFITDDPEPVDLGHWEVYGFSAGAIDAHDATGVGPAIEVNYGAAPNLQLHLIANLAYDLPKADQGNSASAIPSSAPSTGSSPPGRMTGFLRSASSRWWSCRRARPGEVSGRRYVQAFLPVWAQKDFGKWTTYGGGGYWIKSRARQSRLLVRRLALASVS